MDDEDDDQKLRADARIGTVLCGKYRLDAVLGVGGMAVVYAATHRNQKRVAVKMLHPELSMHKEVRARFLREGYAANTVDHPGAVAVLDDDIAEDGAAFLVMERLEGEEVERLWERHGRLDARVALAIADPLLAVLQAAHAKAIIHRDIKPANLYITHDGTLKVLDFGIARARDAASEGRSGTKTGMLLGTPAYMAPEQALAKSKEIDGTTDLWAVGATMYTLLSGQLVHDAESATAILVQAATQPARSLSLAAPHVDPRVVALVDRALAFDRAARWPSAADMRAAVRDLYQAMFGTPVSKDPLERLVAATAGTTAMAATQFAPTAPPSSYTPPPELPSRPPSVASSAPVRLPSQPSYPSPEPRRAFPSDAVASHASRPSLGDVASGPMSPSGMYVGPEGPPVAVPPARPTARPLSMALLLALVAVVAVVAGVGIAALAWRRPSPEPIAPVVAASTPEPVSAAMPPPDAASTADVDVTPAPATPATGEVPSSSVASPTPGPLRTAHRSPPPWPVAPAPVPQAPAPAPLPPPVPVAPAPAPACRAQCVDANHACHSRCKAQYGPRRERHPCLVDCDAQERECKSHAPC